MWVSPPRGPPWANSYKAKYTQTDVFQRFMDLCILFVKFFSCVDCFLVCWYSASLSDV